MGFTSKWGKHKLKKEMKKIHSMSHASEKRIGDSIGRVRKENFKEVD